MRTVHTTLQEGDEPDGLAVDDSGDLHVAMWAGSRILRISADDGRVLGEQIAPAAYPTCIAFSTGVKRRWTLMTTAAAKVSGGRPYGEAAAVFMYEQ